MTPANWSGRLQDHYGPCPVDHGNDADCHQCRAVPGDEGGPGIFWGSWYRTDIGECDGCHADDVSIADFYDSDDPDDQGFRCLPCVLRDHAAQCGCALWDHAERAFGIEREAIDEATNREEPTT